VAGALGAQRRAEHEAEEVLRSVQAHLEAQPGSTGQECFG
jgi:hypothetical protein